MAKADSNKDLISGLQRTTVASICDACDTLVGRSMHMRHDMRALVAGNIVGPAVTSLLRPAHRDQAGADVAMRHSVAMIDQSEPGQVGVIVMEDGLDTAALGGLMSLTAKVRGMAGLVVDGGVRDLAEIRGYKLPVYARSASPAASVGRFASVAHNEPVSCAGVLVRPGDLVVAGEDGVVIVPIEYAQAVLEIARGIDEREARMVREIRKTKAMQPIMTKYKRS